MYDDGTNGDTVIGDNIYSIQGIDLEQGTVFSIAIPYIPLSGTVYSDQGVTPITTGVTMRLLKNGVDTGLTAVTDVLGNYIININAAGIVAEDILTVFIDGSATHDGVTVTRALGSVTHTGIDIYKDYLIARSETGTAITNTDLDTAHNGDADFTTIYSNGGGASLTTTANKNFLVWAGDTWDPGGASVVNSNFWNFGTATLGALSMSVGGNFYVDNAAVFTHTGTLTLLSFGARTFNQGDDPIGSDIINTNSSGVTVVTNPVTVDDFTNSGSASFIPHQYLRRVSAGMKRVPVSKPPSLRYTNA